jgi:hypothetical protein
MFIVTSAFFSDSRLGISCLLSASPSLSKTEEETDTNLPSKMDVLIHLGPVDMLLL